MRARRIALLAAPALVLLAACSSTASVSATDLATQVSKQLTDKNGLDTAIPVTCNGNLEAKVGATQTCVVKDPISGSDVTVVVTATSVDGTNVGFDVKPQESGGGTSPSESAS